MASSWRTVVCATCRQCSPASSSRLLSTTASLPSGHNKWSKIKHKKAANDLAKSSTYSNLSREMIAAVRNHPQNSISPEHNARLAMILKKAKDLEIPKEKIEATLKKAENAGSGGSIISYEAVGPTTSQGSPVAMIIECQSDSPARTMAKVKEAINKHNARLSSTSHLFERTGVIRLNVKDAAEFDRLWEVAVENGAEDVRQWETDEQGLLGVEVICNSADVQSLASTLSSEPYKYEVLESEVKMVASGPLLRIKLDEGVEMEASGSTEGSAGWLDEEDLQKLDNLVAALEEGADCQRVWSNVDGWPA